MSAGVGKDPVTQPISRKGYFLKDLARSFLQVLGESRLISTSKLGIKPPPIMGGGLILY